MLSMELKSHNLYYIYDDTFEEQLTTVQVVTEPYTKIVEVPVYQEIAAVVDDPPLPPDVEFNIYQNDSNTLLISLTNMVGAIECEQMMFPGDSLDTAMRIRRKQDRDYTYAETDDQTDSPEYIKNKILYKADDYPIASVSYTHLTLPTTPYV